MIHVVAGVLSDAEGRVLLAQRPSGKHSAGLWEFPGGKLEPGETAHAALSRELHEEIGAEIGAIEPLIAVPWDFGEKSILLDVYRVLDFAGELHGREGQALAWRHLDELNDLPMPPPDRPVVTALRLPAHYAITPEPGGDDDAAFLARVDKAFAAGVRLLQLRAKTVPMSRLRALAHAVRQRARDVGASVLINSQVDIAQELDLDGVHLPAAELMQLSDRPRVRGWVAASCHDSRELAHAAVIGVDFAVVGSVLPTRSHPDVEPLGWPRFAELCAGTPLPVFALGGLQAADLPTARAHGAQGIAGISAFFQ